ncbi:MAG: ABC transporter substrate-binding protein [Acidobacteria bacterium]|nr:ABC transporter substrate-binding protein [Acidobacteriota bacterium]
MRLLVLLASICACSLSCGRSSAVRIGSKNFTESIILGEIVAGALEQRGVPTDRRLNLGGTFVCHKALVAGELDLYCEYTGTALTAILKLPPAQDPHAVLQSVRDEYVRRYDLRWSDPFGFDDTFAIVVRGADARGFGLNNISDLSKVQDRFRPGFGYEFLDRPDGWPGLQEIYHLNFATPARSLDLGLLYQAIQANKVDVVAGNSTDGLIAALDLVVLHDDLRFFPPYEAAAVYRPTVTEADPRIEAALGDLHGTITDDAMRTMNYEVDGRHRDPRDVALEFLRKLRVSRP